MPIDIKTILGTAYVSGYSGYSGYSGPILTNMPPSTNTTIVLADAGKYLNISTNVTINSSTGFASGDMVSVFNNSAANITITATGVTLRLAGTALTGTRTVAQYGLATILCYGSNTYVISGGGVS